jgi:ABC-type nitrate/sulfonate/bicarbonate transport system ATPase subunit/ABC-type nitrate/sulfonate/bicarbonate transport system permease component
MSFSLPVMDSKKISLYGLGTLLLLVLWALASFMAGRHVIPSPWQTAVETASLLCQGYAWRQILITVARVAAGFSIALAVGLAAGIASGLNGHVETLLRPLVLIVQGTPPLLWIIPLIMLLGVGGFSPISAIALICFPIVALNVNEGVKTVPLELRQMLDVVAPGIYPRVRELILPHLRPFLAASVKLGIVLGIKASVIAEYFGANNGIGFQVQAAFQSLQMPRLFAWGVIFIVLILITSRLLGRLEQILAHAYKKNRLQVASVPDSETISTLKRTLPKQPSPQGLVLKEITFSYPGAGLLFDRINLSVQPDEIVVISGDSGVGKTTLLHTAAGLLKPQSGTVQRPGRVGVVFQDDRFLPWRSNARNVALPLLYAGVRPADATACACRFLADAGLGGWETAAPEELSGGMKKRLALARCLSASPDLMLLDEPFNGLDESSRRSLWSRFMHILGDHHGPVLIVTHFPAEVPPSLHCRFYTLTASPEEGKNAGLVPQSRGRVIRI